jgi:hypothetical protein
VPILAAIRSLPITSVKITSSLFVALLLLAASCQTEKSAFQFRAAPTPTAAVPTTEQPVPPAPTAISAPLALPTPAAPVVAQRRVPNRPRFIRRLVPLSIRTASAASSHSASARITKHRRPQQAQLEHTAAFVLGVALVAGGVIGGILLGGWLGLGVGALVVLLGYYFLGVGIGGKHAWLEVFQEFFNM